MRYKENPKHKEPWQPGRRGSLCPHEIGGRAAQRLLDGSVSKGKKRYATSGGLAFCAQKDRQGFWHGYPVAWHEVPPKLVREWVEAGLVKKSQVNRNW